MHHCISPQNLSLCVGLPCLPWRQSLQWQLKDVFPVMQNGKWRPSKDVWFRPLHFIYILLASLFVSSIILFALVTSTMVSGHLDRKWRSGKFEVSFHHAFSLLHSEPYIINYYKLEIFQNGTAIGWNFKNGLQSCPFFLLFAHIGCVKKPWSRSSAAGIPAAVFLCF